MKLFGLIGYPLSHSFSKKFFTEKFEREKISDCRYDLFPIQNISMFTDLIKNNPELTGLNVTIPYKEQVMSYLDKLDDTASSIKAVNCIKIDKTINKTLLTGFNTDVYGFEISLKPLLKPYHKKALILGSGGASKAIKYVLKKLNIDFISASIEELKENEIRYEEIDEKMMNERLVIIHATPLGTYPNIKESPAIPYDMITNKHLLFDLVYNPEITRFMQLGIKKGAVVKNGLEMLYGQAEKAWEIWNSIE